MTFPSALGLGLVLCSLLLHAAEGECPGESPTKQLLCYVDRVPAKLDPCLCTHLVIQTPLDKLTPQSELLSRAARLREQNPSLRLVVQASESAEVALKRRASYAQAVAAVVAKCGLDGVEVALRWGKTGAGKVQLVDFVKALSKELEKLEPKERSKRSYKIYENIAGDVVTPRWTPPSNRNSKLRKTREAEGAEKEKENEDKSTMEKDDENKEESKGESKQEIEEEPEAADHGKQILLHLTADPQALAKNYDLKRLSKYVTLFTLATDNMTDSTEAGRAYHPARLMGIEDILNADSLVDLVTGLGGPHEKLVLSLPTTAARFTLADKQKNMPRSAVVGAAPTTLTRAELCKTMGEGEWTLERDEDLTAPYAFHDTAWIAFDDPTSVSIKGKYILLRDLAGAGVRGADAEDWSGECGGPTLVRSLHDTFTHIARKSRAAQLISLQEQLHEANQFSYSGDIHLSPYRIVRVVDREGDIHVVRKEAKTEFECSRQGYFRHPSGCNRFYRCVKFNQYSPEYTVFEYDCPAGLAFDETVEVCVWPGSLADGGACQGSSEIAPVPRNRFVCPAVAGYYADPENCRWFFACLDHHGDGSPLTAYEFRCPFGLVFDEQKLVCDWPWLVPGCGGAGVYSARFTVGDFYEGRHRPSYASLSDVHVSGGRIENVPGGVVLGSAISGIGAGAYQGSYASGSNVGAGAYSGAGAVYDGATGQGAYVGGGSGLSYGFGGPTVSYQSGSYGGAGSAGTGSTYNSGASSAYNAGAGSAYKSGHGSAYNGEAGTAYSGATGTGHAYLAGAGAEAGTKYSGGAAATRDGSVGAYGSYGSGAYATGQGAYVEGNSGSYVEDNSGAYFHDGTGDTGGLYSGQDSYGGQYKGSYVGGGAYVPGLYDNGAYKGSYSSGGQYKGSYVGGGAYSGSYDKGIYSGSAPTGGQYKGVYDASSYSGKYDAGAYAGKYDGGAYSGKYDAGAYAGKYDGGAYSGKYDGGAYSGKYDGGAYSGKYDGGAYSGKFDGGAYSGASDSGDYHGGNYFSGASHQAGFKAQYVPTVVDEGYGSNGYNNIDILHKPAIGLVGLDAVKVSGGDTHSGGYISSYSTPSPVTPVSPVVSSYSTVTPPPVVYSTIQPTTPRPVTYYPSSTITPVSSTSTPLISYSTVKPPAYVQTYEQPSYVKSVTPVPSYSYPTPTIGVVKTPVVPLNPVTYTYKQPLVNTEYVSTYSTPSPANSVSYQPSVNTVTSAPYQDKGSFEYAYQRPLPPAYVPPLPSYSYEYKPPLATYVKPVEIKYSYPKPAVLKTPIVPLNPIQYTPTAVEYNVPLKPISYSGPGPISYPSYPTPAPHPAIRAPYVPTVYKTHAVPLNPIQYTTPAPGHYEYSTPTPIKTYSSPIPPVRYQHATPVRPNVYSTQSSLVNYEHSTTRPVIPVQPLRPITYSTPAPISVNYHKAPTVLKTPVVPFNPVQYTTPAPVHFEYSTPAPPRLVSFDRPHTTPAPVVSYEYSPPAPIAPVEPLRPVVYSAPNPIGYDYPKPVAPFVEKNPVIPLNPIQYTTPSPQLVHYPAPALVQPVSYVKPVVTSYSTLAPPPAQPAVVSTYSTPTPPAYSSAPLKPFRPHSTPAPPTIYEYSSPAVRPVVPTVFKTPVVPLNNIQYTTPAPIHFEYSTPAPVPIRPITHTTPAPDVNFEYLPPAPEQRIKPLKTITYSTPSPDVYQYQVQPVKPLRPIAYSTPAPAIRYEYSAPVVRPIVPAVLKTPVVPLNHVQYTTPAPIHFEYSTPAAPLKPISYSTPSPVVNYQYLLPAPVQPVKHARPIAYSTPESHTVSYEYSAHALRPVVPAVFKTPVVPLNPIQYTTPAQVYFEHSTPSPIPVKPVRPITYTTSSPAINIDYVPQAPVQTLRPLKPVVYSTQSPPVSYEYLPPAPIRPVRPLKPVVYSTPAPPVSYEYLPAPIQPVKPITLSSPAPFSHDYKYQPIRPVPSVLKSPVVPLNPIQYYTPPPTPVIQYTTSSPDVPVSYAKPLRPVTYTPEPAVNYEYSTPVTPVYERPVPTVLKTPVVPLNPVQYSTPAPVINQYRFGVAYQHQPEIQYEPEFHYKQQSSYKKNEFNEGYNYQKPAVKFIETPNIVSTTPIPTVTYSYETPEPVTPVYKQVYNYIKAPMVSAYEKVLNAISYSTTPAPAPLPIQAVTQSPVSYAPVNVGSSYNKPVLVKTPSIPVTPVTVVPEYQKVLNVVKATTNPAPVYVNHYTSSFEHDILPVSTPRPIIYKKNPAVVTESTYVKDYAYEENVDEIYDVVKSDFGTRLSGFEEGNVYNQRVEVPQVVYTYTTPAPVPVVQQTYKPRKPVKTYLPSVTVGYEGGTEYTSSALPVAISSSDATYGTGEQYHKETSFTGYTGHSGDLVSYEEIPEAIPIVPVVTSTTQGTTLKVSRPEGGYYVRKQKVRVRPVVVTTENYPTEYTSTYIPSSVSTTTFTPTYSYSTTKGPKVTSTTIHPDDVVDVEGEEEEEEVKILEEYNGQYGGIVNKGGYSVSSTVASIEDGEAIVGVLKKGRITYDGRRTKSKVVVVSKLSDFNPLLVGKLGAECSCDGKSNNLHVRTRGKQRGRLFTPSGDSTIPDQQLVDSYQTSTSTVAPLVSNSEASYESSYESASFDKVVEIKPLRKKVRYYSTTTTAVPEEEGEEEAYAPDEPNLVPVGADRVKADTVVCNRAGLFRHPNKCNKFYSCDWDQWKKKFTLNEFKCPIHLAYDSNLGACNWPSKGPACSDDNLLV